MNDLIQMNRFSELHDDERIVFCKIDHVMEDFRRVSTLPHKVVMLIMNGDYSFTPEILKHKPHNVKHIFATNSTVYNNIVTPIPIGVENQFEPERKGHGMINDGIFEKLPFLLGEEIVEPEIFEDKLYANFNINTNFFYRDLVKQICTISDHVNFEYGLTYKDYVKRMKEHLGVVSPTGNGLECIRTYEALYLDCIPVCVGDQKKYEAIYNGIYKFLPIVFLSNPGELNNIQLVKSEINKVKNNSKELIDYEYWVEQILKKV
jgi:hypothetical protein